MNVIKGMASACGVVVRLLRSMCVAGASAPAVPYAAIHFRACGAAFIGSNYIAMPYAFSQGGIVAASIGIIIIAWVTGYCCNLLVHCKRKVRQATLEQLWRTTYHVPIPPPHPKPRTRTSPHTRAP